MAVGWFASYVDDTSSRLPFGHYLCKTARILHQKLVDRGPRFTSPANPHNALRIPLPGSRHNSNEYLEPRQTKIAEKIFFWWAFESRSGNNTSHMYTHTHTRVRKFKYRIFFAVGLYRFGINYSCWVIGSVGLIATDRESSLWPSQTISSEFWIKLTNESDPSLRLTILTFIRLTIKDIEDNSIMIDRFETKITATLNNSVLKLKSIYTCKICRKIYRFNLQIKELYCNH